MKLLNPIIQPSRKRLFPNQYGGWGTQGVNVSTAFASTGNATIEYTLFDIDRDMTILGAECYWRNISQPTAGNLRVILGLLQTDSNLNATGTLYGSTQQFFLGPTDPGTVTSGSSVIINNGTSPRVSRCMFTTPVKITGPCYIRLGCITEPNHTGAGGYDVMVYRPIVLPIQTASLGSAYSSGAVFPASPTLSPLTSDTWQGRMWSLVVDR